MELTLTLNPLAIEHRVVVMTLGSHQEDPKLNHMCSQFLIPDLWNLSSELVGTLAVRVQLRLGWNTYFISILILWTLWRKPMREGQKALFCWFLFLGGALIVGGWWVVGCCRKSNIGSVEIASFSSQDFSLNMAHSDMLYRLSISTFYKPLLLQIFIPWKFIKT